MNKILSFSIKLREKGVLHSSRSKSDFIWFGYKTRVVLNEPTGKIVDPFEIFAKEGYSNSTGLSNEHVFSYLVVK